jgi:SAM-dependent methyltransferase
MNRRASDAALLRAWYSGRVERYGDDVQSLGWSGRASQSKRFDALCGLGAFHERTLLDVGCGFGDLLAHLNGRGVFPRYTGVDLCEAMVARCRERFPEAAFERGELFGFEPKGEHDFVVASGLFGLRTPRARARLRAGLSRLFSWCRVGAAVNLLSRKGGGRSEQAYYVEPAEILELGLSVTPAVSLKHDYLPNDFTLYLYKSPSWRQDHPGGNP